MSSHPPPALCLGKGCVCLCPLLNALATPTERPGGGGVGCWPGRPPNDPPPPHTPRTLIRKVFPLKKM